MKSSIHSQYVSIINGKKIEDHHKKYNIKYEREDEYNKIIKWMNKHKGYYYLLKEPFWCYQLSNIHDPSSKEELKKIGYEVEIDEKNIKINGKEYPNVIDVYKMKNITKFIGNDIFLEELFGDLVSILNKKDIVEYLGVHTIIKKDAPTKIPYDILTKLLNGPKLIQYELLHSIDKKKKYNFELLPTRVISELEKDNLNKLNKTGEEVSFDLGFVLTRKMDKKEKDEEILLPRFKAISEFLLKHSKEGACYVIYYYNGFSSSFANYVAYLSQYFKKINIYRFLIKQDIGIHLWIKCYEYVPQTFVAYQSKYNYVNEKLMMDMKIWNQMNINYFINESMMMRDFIKSNQKINFSGMIPKIQLYLENAHFPINVVYNEQLEIYTDLSLDDMNKFVEIYYKNEDITNIVEYELRYKNWLILSGLLNQQNMNFKTKDRKLIFQWIEKKKREAHFDMNGVEDSFIEVSSLPIEVKKIHDEKELKTNEQNALLIIHDNLEKEEMYKLLGKCKICMIKKDVKLPFKGYYFYDKSENFYYLKKNSFQL